MPMTLEHAPHAQQKPHPNSHDCSHEHSLDHWLEVYSLVEEEYLVAVIGDGETDVARTSLKKHPARSAVHHYRSAPRL
jgi:hypothetical protein